MSRTVREVLDAHLGDRVEDPGVLVDDILRDLREVLTAGAVWRTRDIPAAQLAAGDVLRAKDGRLWAVTAVATTDGCAISPELVRGAEVKTPAFHPRRSVQVLLAAQDVRALALLKAQLGATLVGREVA